MDIYKLKQLFALQRLKVIDLGYFENLIHISTAGKWSRS